MVVEILIWWLVIQALGVVGLPLSAFLLRALPDQGYAFAKPLGLLLVGYLSWLVAMLGLASFRAPLLIVAALVVLGVGLLALPRAALEPEQSRLQRWRLDLAAWWRRHWRWIVFYELLFLVALVFLALLRAHAGVGWSGPNPWGTERPMDFAFFNAIRRSDTFPPHDPWLAGYSINYYYFGYLLMAVMATLSGLEPSVAYNLSLALIFALTALGAAGIVGNLIALTNQQAVSSDVGEARRRWQNAPLLRAAAMLLTVLIILLVGNQGGVLQVISGTKMILALDGADQWRAITNGLGARQVLPLDPPFSGWDFDGTSEITPVDAVEQFDWWSSSRALWDRYTDPANPSAPPSRRYAITEFPIFSFWLGDMHPHVMSLPFCLLAIALALQLAARRSIPPFMIGRRGWLELMVVGIVLGSLYAINSWDFPTYLLLYLGALGWLHWRLAQPQDSDMVAPPIPWRLIGAQALGVLLAAVVMFAPFYMTFRSLVGGKEPLINVPLLASLTRILGVVYWDHTSLHTFLIIFGLFFVPLLGFAWLSRPSGIPARLFGMAAGVLLLGIVLGAPLLALFPLAFIALWALVVRPERKAEGFGLLLFALGALICFGTEIVYIRDSFEGSSSRMNTIFKFYYQIWLIWGVAAGYAIWWLLTVSLPESRRRWAVIGRGVTLLLTLVLLIGALVYPWLTVVRTFQHESLLGLQGETPRQNTAAGAASIIWLRANVAGSAVILEAVGDSYDSTGMGLAGVSASTGNPTVLGWPGHERQWRGGDPSAMAQIDPRRQAVESIYNGSLDLTQTRELLDRYKVAYIYVGQAERQLYAPEGLARLEQLGTVVFQQDEVTIYQVTR